MSRWGESFRFFYDGTFWCSLIFLSDGGAQRRLARGNLPSLLPFLHGPDYERLYCGAYSVKLMAK